MEPNFSGATGYFFKAESLGEYSIGDKPTHQALDELQLNVKLEKYVLIEVAAGQRQMVELTAAEIIKRARKHRLEGTNDSQVGLLAKETDVRGRSVGELTYRDIRQILSPASALVAPSIEVRKNCILLCIVPITAILFHDRCALLVSEELDMDSVLIKLEEITGVYAAKHDSSQQYWTGFGRRPRRSPETQSPLQQKMKSVMLFGDDEDNASAFTQSVSETPRFISFPLEFAMIELCVAAALSHINAQISGIERMLESANKHLLKKNPTVTRFEELHFLKGPSQALVDRIMSLSKSFKDLLSSPEDLNNMELTKLYYRQDLYNDDANPNLEILLEFFEQEIDQLLVRIKSVTRSIDNAERLVNLRLSVTRNRLIFYELSAALLVVGLNFGSCISGIFGMNLLNEYEESNNGFWLFTSIIIACACAGILSVVMLFMRFKI
eukprot:Protomagalhaensia_wolfi_Nauph_80__1249@NODE_1737_length_1370_cov_23_848986_g1352_i0_p1_GENE_NODE_1737_length_1370_cov_23_848986_g1352_i0NODE_1737_length_1370_cov_23_848986_g1352_i0_p1_ORF_typecomplete_len439_score70_72CorA/PF01544_18/5_3e12DUF2207/PF09972_9/0_044_NODE_1737_length_1370_cov_23_848986_g1352_i0401356